MTKQQFAYVNMMEFPQVHILAPRSFPYVFMGHGAPVALLT